MNKQQREVICDYCGQSSELVTGATIYPHRPDLSSLKFWSCSPCRAYVGCHKLNIPKRIYNDCTPLGRLANAELRNLKKLAHAAFDPYWKEERRKRTDCYEQLAIKMGIKVNDCHIGMFSEAQCRKVIDICRTGLFK